MITKIERHSFKTDWLNVKILMLQKIEDFHIFVFASILFS